jgi:hypothetical protein
MRGACPLVAVSLAKSTTMKKSSAATSGRVNATPAEPGNPASFMDALTKRISVFQLAILAMGGILSFVMITRVQQSLDDQKFLQSINGYVSDLKPAVNVSCANLVLPDGSMLNQVSIRNLGKNVVRVTSIGRELRDAATHGLLKPSAETLPTALNGMDMDLTPGTAWEESVPFERYGGFGTWSDTEVAVNVSVATSDTIVMLARTVLAKRISDSEVDSFSKTKVRCRASLVAGGPRD